MLNSRGVLRTSVLYYLTWILKVGHIGSMTKLDLPAAVLVVLISLCCETGSVAAQQHAGICTDGQNLDAQKESAAAYTISFDYIKKVSLFLSAYVGLEVSKRPPTLFSIQQRIGPFWTKDLSEYLTFLKSAEGQ